MAFKLPDLPYDKSALEPHIDAKTMEIHHDKHHGGYVKKLNAAVEGTDLESNSIAELCLNIKSVPQDKQKAVRNNGGGHFNHSLFWPVMTGDGSGKPKGEIADAIDKAFGSFDKFKEEFTTTAKTRFGSGWAWLGVKSSGDLCVCSTPNQDNPLMKGLVETECVPILGLDVWEHAYYLNYQNKRPDYIDAWWNVVNWDQVTKNYIEARGAVATA